MLSRTRLCVFSSILKLFGRSLGTLLVLLLAGMAAHAQSPISLVQQVGKDAGTSSSSTLAFPSNNTPGNFIAVVVRAGKSGQVFTISDTANDTFKKAIQSNQTLDTPNGETFAIFYAENINGGANNVTVADSIAGNTLRYILLEYSGVAASSSFDGAATANGSTTSVNSGNITTTAAGDLLLGQIVTANGDTITAGSGFTIRSFIPPAPSTKLAVEDSVQGAAGSVSATGSIASTSDNWGASIAAFKAASTTPPVLTLTPTSGSGQTATDNTAFGSPLAVTVTDASSHPVGGITVTFNAPTSGASATFAGGVNTAVTNTSGVATSPTLTANGTPGSYTIAATATNATNSASFSLTNVAPVPKITYIQSNGKDGGTTSSLALAFSSATTAGNWIGVLVRAGHSGQAFTITDSQHNTFQQAVQMNDTLDMPNGDTFAIYYAENIGGGADTVTITDTIANNTLRAVILEYSGVATSSSFDGAISAQGTGTSPNSGSINTTANGDLLLGELITADAESITAGSGFTMRQRVPPTNSKLGGEDQIQSLAGSASATGTLGSSDVWGAAIAAFKLAGGVATSPTTTTASNATATFSNSNQNVTLSATVTSSGGTVNSGTMSFAVSQGGTTIGTAVSGTVSSGAASATFVLPGGTSAGSYTITATYSGGGGFSGSSDNSHTLTVSPAATTTTATNVTAAFSPSAQSVTLSATVTSGAGTVNSGNVTFTVSQGGTQIGTAVTSGTVASGAASATFTIPAGTSASTYTITAKYNGTTNLSTSTDATHTLTITPAVTTHFAVTAPTTASAGTSFSFTVTAKDASNNTVTTYTGTVHFTSTDAQAVLPGDYTFTAGSDNGSHTFSATLKTLGNQTITATDTSNSSITGTSNAIAVSGATTTFAANATATFNSAAQNVTLSATVTSTFGTVNAGTVTFTVSQQGTGTQIGTPVTSGTVASGAASATFSIPAGTAAGTYVITAAYSGGGGFAASSDNTHALTIAAAATTTTASNASVTFNTAAQSVTLSANVTSGSGTVNSGTVTFTVSQGGTTIGTAVTSGTVASGAASAVFSVPAGTAAGTYTITATYNGTTNLNTSSDNTHTLTVAQAATTTTAANVSAGFSTSAQNITLSATVTSPSGPVNSGTVSFTVSQGGTQIGTAVTSGTVASGAASATFVLPASTASGTYTITATYSGTSNLLGSSDNTHTLTVGSGATTTAASNASVTFNTAAQNVTLSAAVTSGSGTVNAGTVTFTVSQGGTTIGTPVTSGTVASGAASAVFSVPAGQAAGSYTITAAYSGGGGFTASSDNTHTLTVTPAATTTAATNATVTFNTAAQNVTLSANVTSASGTVNSGTVTFTVSSGGTTIGTPVTSGAVASGAASAVFSVPAGTAVGSYTITAVYNGTANLSTSSDNTHTLTVTKAATTTTAANASANFSSTAQNVTLSATVTSPSGTVNSGTVTFTVSQGGTTIGTPVTSGTVASGAASATFVLPANTPSGTYTITAAYSGTSNLLSSSDNTHTLTVASGATTTTGANATVTFNTAAQNVTLSATVTSGAGTVNAGTVTFTVSQGGTTVGTPVTSGTVTSGAASATFSVPAGQSAGTYTITAAYSGGGGFSASSDNTHTLTVSQAATTTVATSASVVFNTAAQNVTLSANVTSASGTVNSGTVTFTVSQGGTQIGTAVTSGTVASGAASAVFSVPAGTPAGSYTITATYSGTANLFTSSDATHALTVTQATTATTASSVTATFSSTAQNITLSATVTSPSGPVNSGTVSFTVSQGGTQIGTTVTSGTVASGAASATFSIPAGTTAGTYTITATYSGTPNLLGSSDATHTLTITASSTTTAGANATVTFNTAAQNVTLSATVTSGAGTVNAGTVTFTVSQSGTTIGTPVTSGTVASGAASATFSVPAGQAAGTYTITAAYNGGGGFAASSDNTHTLTVNQAATTTTASSVSANFSTSAQNVTLSASVTSPSGTVNSGSVLFTVSQSGTTIGTPVSGTVSGGTASATFVLPASTASGTYTITASYGGTTNLLTSSDNTHTLTVGSGATTTTAAPATATFATSAQSVTLSATITSASGTVNAGTVTFTVSQGGTTIGTPVTSGTVASGSASASFTIPPNTGAGSYTITAAYSGGGGFSASSDSSHTLTINQATTTTAASSATAVFNSAAQNVTLSATVTFKTGTITNGASGGTVTFTVSQGGTTIGTPVTSGTVVSSLASATFSVPAGTAVGTYTITAVYSGTTNLTTSSDNTATLTVTKASTTTVGANALANFSSTGQNVTLSATVTSPSGTVNSGTVTFTVSQGGTTIGTPVTSGTVASGAASAVFSIPAGTAAGTYTITAAYSGTGNLASSSDATHTLTISANATTTAAANASVTFNTAAQNVTLSATVTSGAGTVNAGTVTFTVSNGGTTIGTPVTSGTVASGAASAVFSVPAGTNVGSYTITASYSGGGGFAASSDATHTLTVTQAATTTTAANVTAPFSSTAQNVTLSATVTSPSGTVNSGTVTFTVSQGGTTLGTPVTSGTVASGAAGATFTIPAGTAAGTYTITAAYSGTTNLGTSSDATHTLTIATTSTTTVGSNASVTFNTAAQNVTLSATVTSGAGTVNAGTVTFTVKQGATQIGTPVTSGTVASGAASAVFSVPAGTAAGSYFIVVNYSGGGSFAPSSGSATLTVNPASTTTVASGTSVVFNTAAQNVTLSAGVSSPSGTVSSGTVTFTVSQGGTTIGTPVTSGTVSGGSASAIFSLPAGTPVGTYTITATYSGTSNLNGSSDNTHTLSVVQAATTTVAANASASFSSSPQNVTLSAAVTSASGTVNSGTVTFTVSQGATIFGTATTSGTVTAGAASVSYALPASLGTGSYVITATYNGTTNLATSSDATHTLTVGTTATTTTAANASVATSTTAQNVSLSATVTSTGGIVNVGTVTFTVSQGGTTLGTPVTSGTVSSGNASATFVVPANTATGTYTITAAYSGGTGFAASSDSTHTLTVTAQSLVIQTTSLPNGQQGVAYSSSISVTGGTPPYTYAVTSGAFPTPVTINSTTGAISGTPTVSGTFTVTIGVTDSGVGAQQQNRSQGYSFTIVGPPTITSANPSTGKQADTGDNITITGQFTHFVQGSSVVSFGSSDITVNSVTVTSSTNLNVNISISATAALGSRSVTVTTGAEVASGTNVFTVLAGTPAVTLSPNTAIEGSNPTITITGTFTHFTQGTTTASFSTTGDITAGPVTVNSPTSATVQIQLGVTAALGLRTITINTGSESAPGSFTVTAGAPVITSVTPNVGGQGVTGLSVVVDANFTSWANGTTVASFGPGIAVGGGTSGAAGPVTVNSTGQFTASLTIASGATLGPRNIVVTTGAEQETSGGAFTVENCTTTAASVLYYSPVYGSSNAPLNTQVQIEFNSPLNRSSLSSTNVYLYDQVTGLHIPSSFTLDATGRIVTITPSQLLPVGRTIYGYLGYGATATDACGNALSALDYFTTAFAPETSGPTVLQTSPINNDTNVPLNTVIALQFSVPIDPLTLQNGFTVTQAGNPVPGTFAAWNNGADYTRIYFTPGTTLTASTVYTVTYSAQLTDSVGNPLTNPGSFNFTTGTASDTTRGTVTNYDPQSNDTGIGTNVAPSFYLSKIIDPISVNTSNAYITDANTGRLIASTVTVSADRMHVTITPISPLQPGTAYAVYLGYTYPYYDLADNSMGAGSFEFTTAGGAITAGPVVTQISPPNGTTGAPVNTQVVAVMSGLIDPNTVGNNAITVTPNGSSTPISGTVTLAADQVTLTWGSVTGPNLSTSTKYNVSVGNFADTQGNPAVVFTSSFTTGASSTPVGAGSLTALSVTPANGATNVSNTAPVTITFSEVIDPATVNNILVRDESNGYYLINGTWAINPSNGAQVTFTPASPYPANAVIQVWTQDAVRDLAGNTDNAYVVTTFTVANTVDTTHPVVTSVTPVNGATGIGRNTVVVVNFSKSIDSSTITSSNIQLFQGDAPFYPGLTVSADNTTVLMTTTLPAASNITLVVSPNVKDLSGNSVTAFQSQFTTAADLPTTGPAVVSVSGQRPASGATDVPLNTVITLFTSGASLNPSTVTSSNVLVSHNGVLIDGTLSTPGDGHSVLFTPSQSFNYGDTVQVFVTAGLQDIYGDAATAYQGSFTVVPNPGSTGPSPIAANPSPEYGATNIALNVIPQIAFDQSLLASTVNGTNVTLYDSATGTYVAGTVSLIGANNNIIQFTPSAPLNPSTQYYYLYLNNVTNTSGKALAQGNGYYMDFTTGTSSVTTPPTVAISPVNGSTGIGINSLIVAKFSKEIDPMSVTGSTIQVSGGGQTVVPVTITFDTLFDTAYITPQAPLPPSTTMTITVNGVTDPEGNAVAMQSTTFTTSSGVDFTPATVTFSITDGQTGLPTNTVIVATYSKPMNTATIFTSPTTTQFELYDTVLATNVPGTITFSTDLMTATFTPSAPLFVGRLYYFYAYNALDLEGNTQTGNSTSFTTAYATSATLPSVVQTNPVTGLTGVPTNSVAQVMFNEPIDPQSVSAVTLLQGGVGGTPVSVVPTLSQGGLVVSLTQNALLIPNTVYAISVTGVQDLAGHTQSGTFTSTFTTGATIDLTNGSVTSIDPPYNQTGVGTNTLIRVHFSKPVNPISVQVATFYISDNNTGRRLPVSLTSISADRLSAVFTPGAPLLPYSPYVFALGTVYDVVGNTISGTSTYFITAGGPDTSGPTVTQISPPNGTTGTPVNTQVAVVMSTPIDVNTVSNSAITVTPSGSSTPISGTVSLAADQVTLTWVPSVNLSTSTVYNISVGGFADIVGNPAVTFTSSFTTGASSTPVGAGALTALSVTPANGAVGVSNTATVTITFSEVIDPATVNNILVRDESNGYYQLSGNWVVNPSNGAQVTFTPAQPYPVGATIQVWTQDLVRDLAGNTDTAYVVTTFTVGTTADTTAPMVTSVTPANNSTNVGPNQPIVLTFSKSINPSTVSGAIQILAGDTLVNTSPTMSANNRTVMLNINVVPSTTYTIVASTQVQDLSGNALQYFQSQFTTAPAVPATNPSVVTQIPGNGATDIPVNTVITLFTNGSPLNASTVTTSSVHIIQSGLIVSGTLALIGNNQAIEFTPSSNLAPGTPVQILLDNTITDVNSVPLNRYNGTFTTGGNLSSVGPYPIAANPNPEYGATNVPLNVIPKIAFDQPLLASTVNSTNVYLYDSSTALNVAGTVLLTGANNNVIQFTPSAPLIASTSTYFLYVNGVTNTSGKGLAQGNGYYVDFNTGTATVTTAPTIVAVGPPNGATNVGINALIAAKFSGPIDPITVTSSTIQITGGGQTVVPASISFNTSFTVAYITPEAPLPANTTMTIAINGITDSEGNKVASQTTTFTTGSGPVTTTPVVVLASAQPGDTIALNTTSFSFEFDRPMNPATINQNTLYFVDDSVGAEQGVGTITVSPDFKTETLTLPPGTLVAGRTVYVQSTGALDLAGNVQNNFSNNSLTVGSTNDTTPPVVLGTNPPASLTTGIPLNVPVQVEFSKEIAQDSVAGVQLLQGGSTLVPVTYTFSQLSHVVILTPTVPLQQSTSYTLSITGVTDTVGNVFSGTQTQTFTTGTAVKISAPVLMSVTPCCGNTASSDLPAIQIVWDSPMDPITFDTAAANATLLLTSTSAVINTTVSFSTDYKTVTLTPSVSLTSGTSYTIRVNYGPASLSDIAGNYYTSSYTTTFIAP